MISLYSFFMAVLWFSVFIVAGTFLQRRTSILLCCRFTPLLLLVALTVFRLLVPIELPFTSVVGSTELYPWVQSLLRAPWVVVNTTVFSGTTLLLGLWAMVSAGLCIRLGVLIFKDYQAVRGIPVLDCPGVRRCFHRVAGRYRCGKRARVVISPAVATPMLAGMIRPVILLPEACIHLSEDELELILAHELAHLASGDIWVKGLIRVLCCVMWWNPLVYLLQKNLESVLEYKCDLAVTKPLSEQERVAYLQLIQNALTQFEEKQPTHALQLRFCGIPEATVVKRRFQLVLRQAPRNNSGRSLVYIGVLLLLFIGSYSVVLQPQSQPPAEDLIGEVLITPENAYIRADSDGTYYFVVDGEVLHKLSPERLQVRPYCFLPVKGEGT